MYKSVFPLTEEEQTWNKVHYHRMLELIKQFPILDSRRDSNNYGEFRFVTILHHAPNPGETYGTTLHFYFHGLHEYRGEMATEFAYMHESTAPLSCIPQKPLDTVEVLKELAEEHAQYLALPKEPQTQEQQTFSMIAELADDDFAISEMEDLEEL